MKNFFEVLSNSILDREKISFTVIKGEGLGEKALMSDGRFLFFSDEEGFLYSNSDKLSEIHKTGIFDISNSSIYAEKIGTEKKLIICGAGHVSMPIIKLAKMIGFNVTVIDDREFFINNAKNAGADFTICETFENALAKINGGDDYYFVIVTRGHRYDVECLHEIMKKRYAYVGMMGSKRRVKIVTENLISEGYNHDAVCEIHAPVGLSINAETPEEISISIMAEIIQIKNQNRNSEFPPAFLSEILENKSGEKVLCTIVSKQGAGPRNVGTKMIYTSEEKILGTIGGGLVEAKVMEKAQEMFLEKNSAPALMKFNLTAGEGQEGEVCGGTTEIFIERV